MTEPTDRPALAPPPSASAALGESDHADDVTLHHHSISDDAPSPSRSSMGGSASTGAGAAAPPAYTSAKASASAFASKLAFGGRKLLSPLTVVASGGSSSSGGSTKEIHPPSTSPPAPPTSDETRTASSSSLSHKHGTAAAAAAGAAASAALSSSLAGANAAASAVTSSLGYLLGNVAATASAVATPLSSSSSSQNGTASTTTTASSAGSIAMDEAELEQLDAEFRLATAQQRMQILEDLVQFRRADWSYLKAMHQGTNYWLNVALLRETQMLAHLGERAAIRRSVQFFYLGLGLGKLMSEVRHAQLVALEGGQLLEELEYYFASATTQSMKLMVATSTPTLHAPLHKMDDDALLEPVHEPFRPTLFKWNQRPVFRRLVTPSIPFPLDYREVMLSLCDILALVYSKFVENNTCSENVFLFQAIVRFDEKIKKLVIDPIKKEFSAVALTGMTEELAGVRKAFASGGGQRPASNTPSSVPHAAGTATADAPPPPPPVNAL